MGRGWLRYVAGMVLSMAAAAAGGGAPSTGPVGGGAEVFETHRLWKVHVRVSAKGWEMMQPTRGSRLAFLLGVKRSELPTTQATTQGAEGGKKNGEGERLAPVAAGYEYAYVRASVEFDGERIEDVGLRFKGNGSYNSSAWLRRPMKVDFGHFVEGQAFEGLTSVNLHNSAVDPSYLRESLAYGVYRGAGVRAPRTGFALMYLTIEGECEEQYLGLYTLVEEVEEVFLRERFGTDKGLLLKPDGVRNVAYLGEDWGEYGRYGAKTEGGPELKRRLIEFTRFLHYADDETFVGGIGSYMDVDGFLRQLAVSTLLSDMDSFLTAAHNYYMYVHPKDGRVHFMPWDMHLSFGGVGSEQSPEAVVHLSVSQPYPGTNRLIERILMIEAYRRGYEEYLREFACSCFSPEKLGAEIDAMQGIVGRAEEAERKVATGPTSMPARPLRPMPELKRFISRRVESVLGQLEGTVEGYVPGKARPAAPPLRAGPPVMVPTPVGRVFKAAREGAGRLGVGKRVDVTTRPVGWTAEKNQREGEAAARKRSERLVRQTNAVVPVLLRAIDPDRSGGVSLDELTDGVRVLYYAVGGSSASVLDEAGIARGLGRLADLLDTGRIEPLAGNVVVAEGEESRPSVLWGKAIAKEADGDGDGRVTLSEAIRAARKWFGETDKDGDRELNSRELETGMDRLMPR